MRWGGGEKVPTLTYVAHLSGDILNAIYYGSSLQNSPTPHFQGPMASCFDKTLRKAWFLFSFYVRPLKTLWIFKTTQYAPVSIWEHTFKKDLCLHTSVRVGSALKKTCSPDADAKQDNSFCDPDATCRVGLWEDGSQVHTRPSLSHRMHLARPSSSCGAAELITPTATSHLIWDLTLPALVSDVSLNTFLVWENRSMFQCTEPHRRRLERTFWVT